jgi:hypothetical protein
VNQNGGEEQGTHGAPHGLDWYGLRWEIVRGMPPIGIRCTWSVWEFKAVKRRANSLNGFSTKILVTFVFKSKRNGRGNWWGEQARSWGSATSAVALGPKNSEAPSKHAQHIYIWAISRKSYQAVIGKNKGIKGPRVNLNSHHGSCAAAACEH